MILQENFKKEVLEWAKEMNVKPKEIHIRETKTKWASCSSKKRLTFSNDLLNQPFEERAKVIVHELLHLKYPKHNTIFNALLTSYLNKKGIHFSIKL